MAVRILVSAASKRGSTAQIATRVGEALRSGLPADAVVDVCAAAQVDEVTPYDAVVLGSAVYMGRWLPEARAAAARIMSHPSGQVWLCPVARSANHPNRMRTTRLTSATSSARRMHAGTRFSPAALTASCSASPRRRW